MTNHPDRAPEIAAFFMNTVGWSPGKIEAKIDRRFPGATDDEIDRASEIAAELLRLEAAEHSSEATALKAERQRRLRGAP